MVEQTNIGERLERYQCKSNHCRCRCRHDSDYLVADHGNWPRLGGERYRSVNELHDLSDHFRTCTRFRADRVAALVPEREALSGLTGLTRHNLKHPAASRPGAARTRVK